MRYAQIRSMDISNGEGIGVSLFVQGCPFHCRNCFNPETWDFNSGKEWTEEIKEEFLNLIEKKKVKRVSLLGGECLAEQNLQKVKELVLEIRDKFPNIKIWLYTGYLWEDIINGNNQLRKDIIDNINILVDGQFVEELKDLSLRFCGSSNQRIIDCKKSIKNNEVILYY